jgi:hypothetical protein
MGFVGAVCNIWDLFWFVRARRLVPIFYCNLLPAQKQEKKSRYNTLRLQEK